MIIKQLKRKYHLQPNACNKVLITANEELEKVNISDVKNVQKCVLISSNLIKNEKKGLVELLKEYCNVFAWSYQDTPRLDISTVCHTLNLFKL